jgi:hypothetical protein
MVNQVLQATEQVVKRSSGRAVSAFMYACASLVGIAALFLLVGGFRVVILNQGFRLSSDKEGTINITFRTDAQSLESRLDTLEAGLSHTDPNNNSDSNYYIPLTRAPENVLQTGPHIFTCADGYYMIGLNLQAGPSGFTSAQIMCRKPIPKT